MLKADNLLIQIMEIVIIKITIANKYAPAYQHFLNNPNSIWCSINKSLNPYFIVFKDRPITKI